MHIWTLSSRVQLLSECILGILKQRGSKSVQIYVPYWTDGFIERLSPHRTTISFFLLVFLFKVSLPIITSLVRFDEFVILMFNIERKRFFFLLRWSDNNFFFDFLSLVFQWKIIFRRKKPKSKPVKIANRWFAERNYSHEN